MLTVDIHNAVARALEEDIGSADITAELIPQGARIKARVISRQTAIVCGCAWFDAVYRQLDPTIEVAWSVGDADPIQPDQTLCELQGLARSILTGERTALNFLQLLSATATQTRRCVDAVVGTRVRILDTRKTVPGLRVAQKYAVTCGGGTNHRMGLYDGILIKENHIIAAGSITKAVATARRTHPGVTVEVETENMAELEEALAAGADVIMLDDFDLETMRQAVASTHGRAKLEVSGGVSLERIRAIAETGTDYISIGGLTKNIDAVDLSMRFDSVNLLHTLTS